jgi:hypothetical protein
MQARLITQRIARPPDQIINTAARAISILKQSIAMDLSRSLEGTDICASVGFPT